MKTQIENFKMKVTPEQSMRVQEVIKPDNVYGCMVYEQALFYEDGKVYLLSSEKSLKNVDLPELTYSEFMEKYGPQAQQEIPQQIDPSELEIAMNAVHFDLKTHELAQLVNLMLSKPDVTIKDLAKLKAKWDKS